MLLSSHWKLLGLDGPAEEHKNQSLVDETGLMEHQADAVSMAWYLIGHRMLPQLIAWCEAHENAKHVATLQAPAYRL